MSRSDDIDAMFEDTEGPFEDGTYTPPGGSAIAVRILLIQETVIRDTEAGEIVDRADFLLFRRSEVDKPADGAKVAISGAGTYIVQGPAGEEHRYTVKMLVRKVT